MGLLGDLVGVVSAGYDMVKASTDDSMPMSDFRGPGGVVIADPYVWAIAGANYRERPSRVGYEVLRYLCNRDSILATVHLTRCGQLMPFCQPNYDDDTEVATGRSTGFRVELSKGAGKRTEAVKRRERELTEFFVRCCRSDVPLNERVDKHFSDFVRKFVTDRLEFDQATAFIERDRLGVPRQFYAIDGSTIRIVDPAKELPYSHVQIVMGRVVTRFTRDEIMFCPENVSASIKEFGYGRAESEKAMRMVQAHLGIDETNVRQFQPGSMPKGLMTLSGADMTAEQLRALEMKYKSMVATFRGKHKVPLLPIARGGKLDFIHFPQATDIEFGNFLNYIVNIICALYRMDPVEINFPNRAGGISGQPGLIQSSPEATRLVASKDKGLRTLLDWFALSMNNQLMIHLDPAGPDFSFRFTGFDRHTESERVRLDDEKSRVYMTINQIREAHGMDAIEGGDIIRDPSFMQVYQQRMVSQQQEQVGQGSEDFASGEESQDNEWEQNWGINGDLF